MSYAIIALGIPILVYVLYLYCTKPWIGFILTLIFNYVIMGLSRYVSFHLPISVTVEVVNLFILFILLVKRDEFNQDGRIPLPIIGVYSLWTFYCCAELMNDTCGLGIDAIAWFRDVRFYGFDPIVCMLVFALAIGDKKDTHKFIIATGLILIAAGAKCFWQKTFGFDSTEQAWLASGFARTHILQAGTLIRYFSFFSDAANYGSHTAMMAAVFGIHMVYTPFKQWILKSFYIVVTIACVYGMFMSGARSGVFVMIGTLSAYILLSRSWKMFSLAIAGLMIFVGLLMFTDYGNGVQAIRRIRSAFNPEDASVQVRDANKDAISKYLDEAPLGIGLGRDASNVPEYNRFRIVATAAPDSSLVYFWMRTGIVGVTLFCFVSFIILLRCSVIVWFELKDPELRTTCATFTAAGAGWFFAGYANQVYFQYPNTFVVFGMMTIVFMAPYLDRKLIQDKGADSKEIEASNNGHTAN